MEYNTRKSIILDVWMTTEYYTYQVSDSHARVALLICVVRLQGLCMPYSADASSTTSRPSATHPPAAFPSQDSAQKITLSTHLQSDYYPLETRASVQLLAQAHA